MCADHNTILFSVKNLFASFFIALWLGVPAQVVVTLQARYLGAPVALDSILIENLSRPSVAALHAPPGITSYDIDLLTGMIINGITAPSMVTGSRLLVCQPGYAQFRLVTNGPENVTVSLFDLSGNLLHTWEEKTAGGSTLIDLFAGFGHMNICTIKTRNCSESFKIIGNLNHYTACRFSRYEMPMKSVTGFDFAAGDRVRFTAIKAGMHRNTATTLPKNDDSIHIFLSVPCPGEPILTDIDGNHYNTVLILDKCWMKENLRVKHYADGSPVPDGTGVGNIDLQYWVKYWFAYNDEPANVPAYGLLYTAAAAVKGELNYTQGICPDGWHVSTDIDWCEMEMHYDATIHVCTSGPDYIIGWIGSNIRNKLMEYDSLHWIALKYANGVANESGFTAMPGGARAQTFYGLGTSGQWWANGPTSHGFFDKYAMPARVLASWESSVWREWADTFLGKSVRCVKQFSE
jgi:uncharacterized protein (TIGR02145 family)